MTHSENSATPATPRSVLCIGGAHVEFIRRARFDFDIQQKNCHTYIRAIHLNRSRLTGPQGKNDPSLRRRFARSCSQQVKTGLPNARGFRVLGSPVLTCWDEKQRARAKLLCRTYGARPLPYTFPSAAALGSIIPPYGLVTERRVRRLFFPAVQPLSFFALDSLQRIVYSLPALQGVMGTIFEIIAAGC